MLDAQAIGSHEDRFEGGGGLNIYFRVWRPIAPPRGIVVIAHGFNSHSGHYEWVGTRLAAAGYAVYALDHRGRGKSDGERFFVARVMDYVDDLAKFIALAKSREPALPTFLLGHSAGGVISCLYCLEHQSELAGLVCESFAFEVPAPEFALAVIKGLSHLAPHAHVLRLKTEDFSRDPAIMRSLMNDPLISNEVQPTQTVAEMVRGDERLKREFQLITLPVLIIHGTADKVTVPRGSKLFFERAGSVDKTLKLYDGYYHDLLNDLGREAVLADVTSWIDERLPAAIH